MNTLQILLGARGFLSDPARWTTGKLMKDKDGASSGPETACTACALGACNIVAGYWLSSVNGVYAELKREAFTVIAERGWQQELRSSNLHPLAWLNDVKGYEVVLEVYDRTIKRLQTCAAAA